MFTHQLSSRKCCSWMNYRINVKTGYVQPPLCRRDDEVDEAAASLAKVDTELSADCIEFCPHGGFHDIFVCGTYQVLAPESNKASAAPKEIQTSDNTSGPGNDGSDDEGEEEEVSPKPTQRTGRLLLFRIGDDRTSLYVTLFMFREPRLSTV